MPVLVGAMGLGGEVGYWYYRQQEMQSAADSAAVAAAAAGGSSYRQEARGVTARYGFVNGQGDVSVEVENGVTCPTPPTGLIYSDCYRVTVESLVPLFLSPIVGYKGNATVDGKPVAKTKLVSTAVAARVNTSRKYCVVTLGEADVKVDLDVNGAPKANLSGCGVMSNEAMVCSGAARQFAAYADSPTGDSSPCGQVSHNTPTQGMVDPYAKLADHIPSPLCKSTTQLSAPPTEAEVRYCGGVKLTADITITTPTVMVINGKLDLNDHKLTGSALTIIFTGINGYVDGKGTLDITAPTSGVWKGVALYQDPAAQHVDFKVSGSQQKFIVKGLFYFPEAHLTLNGAVNKDVNPAPCLVLMVGSLKVDGGGFFANSDKCTGFLDMPSKERGRLVS
jgi:hypothetical protein